MKLFPPLNLPTDNQGRRKTFGRPPQIDKKRPVVFSAKLADVPYLCKILLKFFFKNFFSPGFWGAEGAPFLGSASVLHLLRQALKNSFFP